ncbi:hypothetical protein CH256_22520 [Rhodococcus sp. 05-2254-6]|nr:hypothetical protein CH256_22520 [Rhodococcus sp. 05-2254-6]
MAGGAAVALLVGIAAMGSVDLSQNAAAGAESASSSSPDRRVSRITSSDASGMNLSIVAGQRAGQQVGGKSNSDVRMHELGLITPVTHHNGELT